MLLETLDLRNNDLLIYSQNMFNFNDNFKIVFKNRKIRRPEKITYFDVCNYVKDPSPKNLIVYRMMTNVNNLDAYSTKYGYFVKINGRMELIYFDPVFAIKDLRHLQFDFEPERFRFKIQQLGLTSLTKRENEPNFAEVYNFDLKASEAQNQNDKIFADAIFVFDPDFRDEDDTTAESAHEQQEPKMFLKAKVKDTPNIKNVAEDNSKQVPKLSTPKQLDDSKVTDLREEIIDLLKQALGIPEQSSTFEKKPQTTSAEKVEEKISEDINLFDLFKSTQKSKSVSLRDRENVILKFDPEN